MNRISQFMQACSYAPKLSFDDPDHQRDNHHHASNERENDVNQDVAAVLDGGHSFSPYLLSFRVAGLGVTCAAL
jgi:hypothetical protein